MMLFFLAAHSVRIPQLRMFDLNQFWDGKPSEKFPENHAIEEKTRLKYPCWFVGSVDSLESCRGCYMIDIVFI